MKQETSQAKKIDTSSALSGVLPQAPERSFGNLALELTGAFLVIRKHSNIKINFQDKADSFNPEQLLASFKEQHPEVSLEKSLRVIGLELRDRASTASEAELDEFKQDLRQAKGFRDFFKILMKADEKELPKLKSISELQLAYAKLAVIAASLELAETCYQGAHLSSQVKDTRKAEQLTARGHVEIRKAARNSDNLLGESHLLTNLLNHYLNSLPEDEMSTNLQSTKKYKSVKQPAFTLNEKGFQVEFQIDTNCSTEQVISDLYELCLEAEILWAEQYGDYHAYGYEYSTFSALNNYGEKGPKLRDPDGISRGRLSGSAYAEDSLKNSYGPYGSGYSDSSICYNLTGTGKYNCPESWGSGVWKIIADQN